MQGVEMESSQYPCVQYDVVSWSLGEQQETSALQEHLQECPLCGEEIEETRSFFATDVVEEFSEEYRGLNLPWIAVPQTLLERLFPKTTWERILDELKKRWVTLGQSPFADIAWEPVRLQVEGKLSPEKRPRYYTGQQITLKLRIDEDCFVMVLHGGDRGRLRQVFPKLGETGFLKLRTYEFPGLVEGTHDEAQRLIALATKTDLQVTDSPRKGAGLEWVETLSQQVSTLSEGEWSWAEYGYRVVEPARVSLEDLAESCQLEIQDKTDKDKPACGEVCRRTLDDPLPQQKRREAFEIFYKITTKLVHRWVNSWIQEIPPEQREDVEAYVQEVYSRLSAATIQYQGYFPLLRYMKEITTRVVIQDYRKPKRQIVSSLRAKLNGLWFRSENENVARKLIECLRVYGLNNPVDLVLLEGLLKGQGAPELREHPLLQERFSRSQAKDIEKFVHNRRDTAIWHAFKSMRQIQRNSDDLGCREVVEEALTR